MKQLGEAILKAAQNAASKIDADVYLYNGPIQRGRDLLCIEGIHAAKSRKRALFLPVTMGGSPDAAYKITRYLQENYDSFSVLVGGLCKSAGTLIALGANEIVFTAFGELGPLDIQVSKVDKFDSLQSGLAIQEALDTLESRAEETFSRIVREYIEANNGLMSFSTAAKAASDFVTQMYAPILSRIDPEEVGARSRSMRIAVDYGKRLAMKSQSLKSGALENLVEKYSSHSFVIDQRESEGLFKNVRVANSQEKALVEALGQYARFESTRGTEPGFCVLSKPIEVVTKETTYDAATKSRRGAPVDGRNPSRTARSSKSQSKKPLRGGKGVVSAAKANGSRPTSATK